MLKNDPLWFKNAIIYEAPVRAFADSNGDGIGDFRGLTEKLDYLQDLGITAIWTLPFFPSPLRDDGYDIADYKSINPIYGNLEDCQEFIDAAHARGIRVIIELVVNHTSDKHPWFQRARRAPKGSVERNFYIWNDNADKYPEVRIIFPDFENSNWAWDSVAQAYYWHRFYYHQPDLNYENPAVQEAVLDVADFWLKMGVDGMRLDAVPYLCVEEGTSCENLPATHAFLKRLRRHIDERYSNRMLLAEANQWPEDVAKYFGNGDECHVSFHFPLMTRLFMALRKEDNFPVSDILKQTPSIPNNCQWALFLRNHDELTLEVVSDEDRDYMYKVYAQDPQARINLGIRRRLAPLLGNDRRQIELMNSLLFSLPGTPVLYYGDEIGMGDNIYLGDRNGVRTPMQWSADRNAGFSGGNPQRLYAPVIVDPEYNYETINVEAQRSNSNSLWWWMKRLISTRERFEAFGSGSFELLHPENRKILAFTRTYSGQHILVVANLSRFVQTAELDLSAFNGMVPVEIFGRTEFPRIHKEPYFFSLTPYGFYWFILQQQETFDTLRPFTKPPILTVAEGWKDIFSEPENQNILESILPNYLSSFPWFEGKNKVIQSTEIIEVVSIDYKGQEAALLLLEFHYIEGQTETYLILLSYLDKSEIGSQISPEKIIAELEIQGQDKSGFLFDALGEKEFLNIPLAAISKNQKYEGNIGFIQGNATDVLLEIMQRTTEDIQPHILAERHDKTLINFGTRLILKLFRKLEPGINAELENGNFLTEISRREGSAIAGNISQTAGYLEYHRQGSNLITIGILEEFIPEARDGWSYTSDALRDYFDRIMVEQISVNELEIPKITVNNSLNKEITESVYDMIGSYLNSAENLGKLTADIHHALASDSENPNFSPEQFTPFYQRSIYQYIRNQTGKTLLKLKKHLPEFSQDTQQLAKSVINRQDRILESLNLVVERKIPTAMRTRCHGDYHLQNVLFTGKDFVIINFEGEATRPLNERRMKRSLLRDIAVMLGSFYYAANVAFREEIKGGMIRSENLLAMEQWSTFWYTWVSISFLKAYLENAKSSSFLAQSEQEIQLLLDVYLLETAIYELDHELTYRRQWLEIPLTRIQQLVP
ncbi:maltose alpha-D-glucosyltransferase [Okeania sp.]|uniref:maltose alpha-D-glucosyltransferase n=1 Tax=Okeania sp. TaxID=3100323 RepID=UPI002B4B1204|nr:maltose alpha-D-glucosyltransferase [Okeania sp.]MEB3340282.1 maltose alpha-D-glucosyltransferase [Okeania sp.]